jgi:hypothetical protein
LKMKGNLFVGITENLMAFSSFSGFVKNKLNRWSLLNMFDKFKAL